ncbi:MAG TPA: dTDP-4-dehydrorhamnose reductase [Thermoanaerobaculia bacterium]|nr:dTDP-4-dehydrorhamnose reductase [Thermoanaerobaculia bacterium]
MAEPVRRWLVTGASGMLGSDLTAALRRAGESVIPFGRAELDLTRAADVRRAALRTRPDVIVNCAAWTKVDAAEQDRRTAELVNGTAVGHLAEAADTTGALLIQISTDFVFDGTSSRPYRPEDPPAPLSAYGASKLIGEREAARASAHLVVRASWLFGAGGPNFVEAIRKQVDSGRTELRVVDDQHGRPTWTPHLAAAIVALGRAALGSADARGIVHYGDEPPCSWFDFAVEIVAALRPAGEIVVRPVPSSEFPRPAARPPFSVLDTSRYESITGLRPASWKEGLARYLGASGAFGAS